MIIGDLIFLGLILIVLYLIGRFIAKMKGIKAKCYNCGNNIYNNESAYIQKVNHFKMVEDELHKDKISREVYCADCYGIINTKE